MKREELLSEAIRRSSWDPAYFGRFFLPRWIKGPMPWFHLGLLALQTSRISFLSHPDYADRVDALLLWFRYLIDPTDPESASAPMFSRLPDGRISMVAAPNNNILVPRGFSKTTTANLSNLYSVVHDASTFTMYVSESQPHAETQLRNIRAELEGNTLLREAYGDQVPERSSTNRWGADTLELLNGAVLMARGRGGQIRGSLVRARRPTRILLDDVEDEESVKTDQQRENVRDWFYGTVVPAGDTMEERENGDESQDMQITILGTLLHPDALMVTVSKDLAFNTIRFGALLPDGTSLWPKKMSPAGYEKLKARYASQGRLTNFYREYGSSIRVEEDALFSATNVRLYKPILRKDLIQVAIALDPAISNRPGADHAAIVVSGRGADGRLYILDVWGGHGKTPREQIDQLFILWRKWAADSVGIEAVAFQRALIFLIKEEMAKRKAYFVVTSILHGSKSKDERIKGILQPRYANGVIHHARPFPTLESQLQDYPNGKVDFPDAAAMSLSLLGETAMYDVLDDYEEIPDDTIDYSGGHVIYQIQASELVGGNSSRFSDRYGN